MSKLFKIAGATILACAFSSQVLAEKVLKVGTEATYAPFEFMDDRTQPQGYDIDIIRAIGKEMGYKVEILNMPFDSLIPSIMTRQIDTVIAAMTITPERKRRLAFSEPYYKSGLSVIIRKDDKRKYKKIEDLDGQYLCTQIGTTGALFAEKISKGKVKTFNYQPDAFLELQNKGCAAVVNDRPVNLYYMSMTKNDSVLELKQDVSVEYYGIAVRKGNKKLLATINEGLKRIKDSGEFSKIHQKWFHVAE